MKITRLTTAVVQANYDYTFVRIETDRGRPLGTGECFFAPGLTAIIARAGAAADRARSARDRAPGPASGAEDQRRRLHSRHRLERDHRHRGGAARPGGQALPLPGLPAAGRQGAGYRPHLRRLPRRRELRKLDPGPDGALPSLAGSVGKESRTRAVRAGSVRARGPARSSLPASTALKFDLDFDDRLTGDELNRPLTEGEIERMREVVHADPRRRLARRSISPSTATGASGRATPSRSPARWSRTTSSGWKTPAHPKLAADRRRPARLRAPILTGENLVLLAAFLPLLQNQAVALIAPDIQKCGGLLEAAADRFDWRSSTAISLAPHCIASPLGLVASAAPLRHRRPNFVALEFHGQEVPFWNAARLRPGADPERNRHHYRAARMGRGAESVRPRVQQTRRTLVRPGGKRDGRFHPNDWTTTARLPSGQEILIRPLRADDAARLGDYFRGLSAANAGPRRAASVRSADGRHDLRRAGPGALLRLVATVPGTDGERIIAYMLLKWASWKPISSDTRQLAFRWTPKPTAPSLPSVADDYQNQGVGSRMLRHIIEVAPKLGRQRIVLWLGVQATNDRAVHFYTRCGFRKVGEFFTDKNNYDMILDLRHPRCRYSCHDPSRATLAQRRGVRGHRPDYPSAAYNPAASSPAPAHPACAE